MKKIYVTFISKKLENNYEKLKQGKFEDKQVYDYIQNAIKRLKQSSARGTKIPRKLWPEFYVKKYQITNLWKYNLPKGWRLIYTIEQDDVVIINIILEWLSHKDYEKRFRY